MSSCASIIKLRVVWINTSDLFNGKATADLVRVQSGSSIIHMAQNGYEEFRDREQD